MLSVHPRPEQCSSDKLCDLVAMESSPREREGRAAGARDTAARGNHLPRLPVVVLIVLGLVSIQSGLGEPRVLAGPQPAVSAAPAIPARSASEVEALRQLIAKVNPSLAPSELSRIASAVFRYSAKYELDPELVTAVLLVESSARPWVRSPKGAIGLMQVMPHMMEPLGLAGNAATIESNIEAGCWILASNIRRLGEEEGISSYFWGSEIRGQGYLERVQARRAEVRRSLAS